MGKYDDDFGLVGSFVWDPDEYEEIPEVPLPATAITRTFGSTSNRIAWAGDPEEPKKEPKKKRTKLPNVGERQRKIDLDL